MERREFLAAGAAMIADWRLRIADSPPPNPQSEIRNPQSAQEPALSPEVFARRVERAQAELKGRKLDCLIATPGTNYEYFTGYNPGRSERLIALVLPATGKPVVVCPAFEVERLTQHSALTVAQLAAQVTEREVAQLLSREMQQRGAPGGGLVQFGPSSALPHGGPAGPKLERETVVLIDAGCRVAGYDSDITRTIWFGDNPADEFKKVFNFVHDAQTAAMRLGKPLYTQCQEMDRTARKVISDGGYGSFFTHRLGHGLGMDGHEPPYLVEGNATRLEPGMVFTIEPGIYQLGKFGVRIEDDCGMTDAGIEVLSHRPVKL